MSSEDGALAPAIAEGETGAVAAGCRAAADTALEIMSMGGNAVDAAIAASAVQCVVEMPWCGLGGDAFAMINSSHGTMAVNGSGVAPAGLNGIEPGAIPRFGGLSVSVPGTVETWEGMATRWGTRSLADLLQPAITMAEEGFAVDEQLAGAFNRLGPELDGYPALAGLLDGNGTAVADTFYQPDLARTLRTIATEGAKSFYEGRIAEDLVTGLRARGGVVTADDLAEHQGDWVEPISVAYRGRRILEHPPVSLGVILLQELKILEGFDLAEFDHDGAELVELMILCKQAAFADALTHVADPHHEVVPVEWLLSKDRAEWWRGEIRRGHLQSVAATADAIDTTSLAVADAKGTTVTFIHSLFNEFGSREAPGQLGVILNDRLGNLILEGGRPGGIRPGHRPVHTLNSMMVMEGEQLLLAGATPGGRGQVQTLFQVLVRILDQRLDLGSALRAPRWLHGTPRTRWLDHALSLEVSTPEATRRELVSRGFQVTVPDGQGTDIFGSCTLVGTNADNGTLVAAADHRRGAAALAF